tara:strand:+ start:624 stop:956 length:333 start_codon:yes stop_codon:yes gene_type:complete
MFDIKCLHLNDPYADEGDLYPGDSYRTAVYNTFPLGQGYNFKPCKLEQVDQLNNEAEFVNNCSESEAEFFGVYTVHNSGDTPTQHLFDCVTKADAMAAILILENLNEWSI